jgi:flagellar motility protein MotE (MotC chaperone)
MSTHPPKEPAARGHAAAGNPTPNTAPRRKTRPRERRGALWLIVLLFGSSGLIRLGEGTGRAFALATAAPPPVAEQACAAPPDSAALLAALLARESALDARDAQLQDRAQAIALAQTQLDLKLAELVRAEERLAATLVIAVEAADADVARLIALYENMKPRDAAALFEAMAPEFAAGFLARMRPDAAAQIMAGISPDVGYAISVLIAGRNANAPKN